MKRMQRFQFNISQKVSKFYFFLNSNISSEILTKKKTKQTKPVGMSSFKFEF